MRAQSFIAGLVLAAAVIALAHGQALGPDAGDRGWVKDGWTDDPAVLCINGRPAPRRPNVTYGHLPTRPGMVRDHVVPLGLGSPDVAENIQYQELAPSYAKDERERHAEETYCANPSPELLGTLRAQFKRDPR